MRFRHYSLAAAFTVVLLVLPAPAQKRTITHEDVFTMKRTGAPSVSPDGKWIVVSVAEPSYDPSRSASDLWIVPTDGSAPPRRLTFTRAGESGAAWAPDSRRIAFSTRREGDDADQIYVLPLDGGEAERVTRIPTGASSPQWRPDGRAILFESMVQGERKSPEKSTGRVFDTMPVRFWNIWRDASRPHVFTQSLDGGAAVDVLAGSRLAASTGFDGVYAGSGSTRTLKAIWSPDGQEVVFVAVVNRDTMMYEETESHLFRAHAGSEPAQITPRGQSFDEPKFSRDGKHLLAHHTRNAGTGRLYSLTRLARVEWPGGAMRLLTEGFDRSVGSYSLSPDGRDAVFSSEDSGFTQLFRVSLTGGAVRKLFDVSNGNFSSPEFAGSALIAVYGSSTQPNEVATVDPASGSHRLLTDFNRGRLDQLDLPAPEHFWFTAKNGKRIHNVIVFPPRLDRSGKYPLVVFPHGGPNSMSGDSFSTRWNYHLLTSPGYVLLMTNYTGSTGFGEKFADDIERDVLKGPTAEILEAAAEAVRLYPFIDGTRQCAIGASYSGYLVNWFNGHTNQFRCLVAHAGASNNESQYGANDGGIERELRMGAPVWETGKGQWMEQSPFRFAGNWKTPTLVTQGELDFRVPLNESMTTFKLLQRMKVPSRLVVFPDEGHWIQKGENSRHHMQEVLGWLQKYLQ